MIFQLENFNGDACDEMQTASEVDELLNEQSDESSLVCY